MSAARAGLALVLLSLLVAPAGAGETDWWTTDSPADYARAEARGVVVGADGALEPGPRVRVSPADSASVLWSLAVLRDGSVAAGADRGRVLRWTAAGGLKPWVRLPVGQVLALAADGDGVVAGTGPEGLVYRIGARGDTALIARTGERYVWGLARASRPGGRAAWYAATGTRGRLIRLEEGRATLALDTDESNLVSIVPDGHGGVYAGGDSHGRIVQVRADGSPHTLFDAAEDEVRALAIGEDGALYAAALSASAQSDGGERDAGDEPTPVKSAVAGGRAVIYRIVPDSSVTPWWISPQPFVFALAPTRAGLLAATGNRAGVFRVERANAAAQLLAAPEGQVTALAVGGDGTVYAATSNPGALWSLGPGRAERGELLSPVLDARRVARFGRIAWRGEARGGKVELYARSGNTDPPDTTWSAWNGGAAAEEGRPSGAPSARYLQWKIVLAGGEPRVASVSAAWREANLAPRVDDLTVSPQGLGFREGEIQPRLEPVTQTLPGGQKVEYTQPPAQSARALRELPLWARGLRTLQWRANDANGDALRFRVEGRRDEDPTWFKIADDLEAPTFTWDTSALPDGLYRVRVVANDAGDNPLGEGLTGEAQSAPVPVDNTPPAVTALTVRAERGAVLFQGAAEDATSALSRVEVSLDGDAWRPVTPDGGFADQRRLDFHGRLDAASGAHTVSVRVVDAAGNPADRAARVTAPR